jgi:hypothetical protein
MASDAKLWKAFSEYIRLRDSNGDGIVQCITCQRSGQWTGFDCGHGIGRQHKATKFDERNNHGQCKKCNGFEGGQQAIYKEEVEKRYGKGTWDQLVLKSRQVCKRGKVEIQVMEEYYKKKVKELKAEKNI